MTTRLGILAGCIHRFRTVATLGAFALVAALTVGLGMQTPLANASGLAAMSSDNDAALQVANANWPIIDAGTTQVADNSKLDTITPVLPVALAVYKIGGHCPALGMTKSPTIATIAAALGNFGDTAGTISEPEDI